MRFVPKRLRKTYDARYISFIERTKHVRIRGFDNVPLYDMVIFFREEIKRDQLPVRAAAISFNFLLALFPSIIFLFTLIPYIPIKGLDVSIHQFFEGVLPTSGYLFLESTITGITSIKRSGLLSLGFIFAFYFSTNGVRMLMLTFNKNHPIYSKRGFWRRRLASFRLTFYLFVLFLTSLILIITGDNFVYWVGELINWEDATGRIFLTVFQYLCILLLFFLGISLLYYYGPSVKDRWRFITPGATFSTIVSILTSIGFGYLANNFLSYNEVYGSIGTLIVLMIWINLNSLVLLIGFEINNSIDVNRVIRQKLKQDNEIPSII